jgi:hypothetical protein
MDEEIKIKLNNKIRSGNGTQKEHMEVARECACVIAAIFPMVSDFVSE